MSRAKALRAPNDVNARALPAARTSRRVMRAMGSLQMRGFLAAVVCAPGAVWRATARPSPLLGPHPEERRRPRLEGWHALRALVRDALASLGLLTMRSSRISAVCLQPSSMRLLRCVARD